MNQMTNRVILIDQTYRKMWGSVLAIFRQACLCEADSEDLAPHVFLRLMSLDLLVPETIEGMTATIAYHFRTDYLRRRAAIRRHFTETLTADAFDNRSSDEHVLIKELYALEQTALDRMAPANRQIYLLSHYADKTNEEIAQTLSMSYRAVESRLYRSRQEVREYVRRMAM